MGPLECRNDARRLRGATPRGHKGWRTMPRRPKTAARVSDHGPPPRTREPPSGLASAAAVLPLLGGGTLFTLRRSQTARLPPPRPLSVGAVAHPPRQ
eukprot:3140036-Alexandrium_andersonii.AAC.1